MKHTRTYQLPVMTGLPEPMTGNEEWDFELLYQQVSPGFIYLPTLCFDIMSCEPYILIQILTNVLSNYRGLQFACGTIITKGPDADIPFLITKSELKRYGISKIGELRVTDELKHFGCTIMCMHPKLLPDEYLETFTFLIKLIHEEEARRERVISQ